MPFKDPKSIAAIRSRKKRCWKNQKMIFEDQFDIVYNDYIKQTNCECCYCEFTEDNKKSLEHDHNNTTSYNIRGIVCNNCNMRREDRKWSTNTGERHIYWCKTNKNYRVDIQFEKKRILNFASTDKNKIVKIRDEFLKKNPWIYT